MSKLLLQKNNLEEQENRQLKADLANLQSAYLDLKNKYKDLYHTAPIGYFNFDSNGMMLEVNQAGAALLGVSRESLLNKSFRRYIAPDFQQVFSQHCQSMQTEKNAASL